MDQLVDLHAARVVAGAAEQAAAATTVAPAAATTKQPSVGAFAAVAVWAPHAGGPAPIIQKLS